MGEAFFWEDNEKAKSVIEECNRLKVWTVPASSLKRRFEDAKDLLPEADAIGDEALVNKLKEELAAVDKELSDLEIRRMLSGELDNKNCFLAINAGAGGTEACDWVLMLSRMYSRWSAKKKWKIELIDEVEGDVAGIKSITFKFEGPLLMAMPKRKKGSTGLSGSPPLTPMPKGIQALPRWI